jgi:hypothetical protein
MFIGAAAALEPPMSDESGGTTLRHSTPRFVVESDGLPLEELRKWGEVCETALDPLLPEAPHAVSVPRSIHVWVSRDHDDFSRRSDMRFESILAVALTDRAAIILNRDALRNVSAFEQYQTIRHELVHLLLGPLETGERPVPKWLHEGLAQLVPGDSSHSGGLRLAWAALFNARIPMNHLATRFPYGSGQSELAYAQSADFTRFVATRVYAFESPRDFFHALLRDDGRARGMLADMNDPLKVLAMETQWHGQSSRAQNFLLVVGSQTLLWGGVVALFVFAYARKKRREKSVMAKWDSWEREDVEDEKRPYRPEDDGWD